MSGANYQLMYYIQRSNNALWLSFVCGVKRTSHFKSV